MSSSSIHAEGPSETTVVVKSMGRWAKLSSVQTCILASCCAECKYDLFCKNVKVPFACVKRDLSIREVSGHRLLAKSLLPCK